jgi:hypothetical protein
MPRWRRPQSDHWPAKSKRQPDMIQVSLKTFKLWFHLTENTTFDQCRAFIAKHKHKIFLERHTGWTIAQFWELKFGLMEVAAWVGPLGGCVRMGDTMVEANFLLDEDFQWISTVMCSDMVHEAAKRLQSPFYWGWGLRRVTSQTHLPGLGHRLQRTRFQKSQMNQAQRKPR